MAASKIALLSHGLLPYCFSLLSSCHSVLMSEKLSRPRWSWFRLVHVRTNCILTFQSSLKIGGSDSASPPFLVCLTIYHSVIRTLYSLRLVKLRPNDSSSAAFHVGHFARYSQTCRSPGTARQISLPPFSSRSTSEKISARHQVVNVLRGHSILEAPMFRGIYLEGELVTLVLVGNAGNDNGGERAVRGGESGTQPHTFFVPRLIFYHRGHGGSGELSVASSGRTPPCAEHLQRPSVHHSAIRPDGERCALDREHFTHGGH